MKSLLLFLIFGILCIMVLGWTSLEITNSTGEYAGFCKSSRKYIGVLKSGEEKLPKGHCVRVRCHVNGDQGLIDTYGCGAVGAEPPCKVHTDKSKLYPDCCPKVSCPQD